MCINTYQRVVKLRIARILPKITDDGDREVIEILKSMKMFLTGGPTKIPITKVLKPNDPWGWPFNFDDAEVKK